MTARTHRQPPGADTAGPLTAAEVTDEADNAVVHEEPPKLVGKRVRAIPNFGGTTVVIREEDFANNGIDHPTVEWDFRKDNFTVPVGPQLSEEAAEWLTSEQGHQFVYVS
jgi:hypothetical protein